MNEVDEHEWVIDPERIHAHVGHAIEIGTYADRNLAIECMDCGTVLADIDFAKEDEDAR